MTPHPRAVAAGLLTTLLAALALSVSGPGVAAAAPATAPTGWLRVGHLSPTTPPVDVYISSYAGSPPTVVRHSAYGAVTPYLTLKPGPYTVAMRPAGAATTTPAMLTWSVNVAAGAADTLLAVGRKDPLRATVITDDLTPPAAGSARVRLLQGAPSAPTLTAAVVNGPDLATETAYGTATGYDTVPAGTWTVHFAGSTGESLTSTFTAVSGSVQTLLVVDKPGGGLTLTPITDAASMTAMPAGGVRTGGGGTAPPPPFSPTPLLSLVVLLPAVLVPLVVRRARTSRS
jgi:hypothetical protein